MMILGIYSRQPYTAATASVRRANGEYERDIVAIVGDNVFAVMASALAETRIVRASGIEIYTNDADLYKFLTPPIRVEQKETTRIFDKAERKYISIPIGGDPNQWSILYGLFAYTRWFVKQAVKLPNTEAIYEEYFTANRGSLRGCVHRLDAGVWTVAEHARR